MTDGGGLGRMGILVDLDGTLIDSVYQHVLAWREALEAEDIDIPVWTIHRRIGRSGGLFTRALLREVGAPISPEVAARLQARHHDAFERYRGGVRPLPGAVDLLQRIARSGRRRSGTARSAVAAG